MNYILILAAGKATRMNNPTPKVLLSIDEKPILRLLVENLEKGNLGNIAIIINQHSGELVRKTMGEKYQYILQKEQLGTGHAVLCARECLQGKADTIIALSGDHPFIRAETFRKMLKIHHHEQAVVTVLTAYVPNFKKENQPFYDFGRIIRDERGKIQAIRELRDCTEEEKKITEVNTALYCFSARWLWENIDKIKNNNSKKEYYLTDLVEIAIATREKVATFSVLGGKEVLGVNTPEHLEIARSINGNKK